MSLAAVRGLVPDTVAEPPVPDRVAAAFGQVLQSVPPPPCTWPVRCPFFDRCEAESVCCASFATYVAHGGGGSRHVPHRAGDRPTAEHWHRVFVRQAEREREEEEWA